MLAASDPLTAESLLFLGSLQLVVAWDGIRGRPGERNQARTRWVLGM